MGEKILAKFLRLDYSVIMATQAQIKMMLRTKGFRATPARIALLSFLAKRSKPVSMKDVMKNVQSDQVTMYRALDVLTKVGIVRQIDLRHGHAHYELVDSTSDHHHLICTKCSKMEDIEDCTIQSYVESILKKSKSFTRINDHTLELFGVCLACKD